MATVLDQSYDGSDDNAYRLRQTSTAYPLLGIQFVPSVSASCNQVILTLAEFGTIAFGNIWAEIWTDSSDEPNAQTGSDSDTIVASTVGATSEEITFTFSTAVPLTNGTKYWIVLNGDYTVDASNHIGWYNDDTSPTYSYKHGSYTGTTWQIQAGTTRAFNFKEYYDSTTSTTTSTSSTSTSTSTSSTTSTSSSSSTSTSSSSSSSTTTSVSSSTTSCITTTSSSTSSSSSTTSTTSSSTTTFYPHFVASRGERLKVYMSGGVVSEKLKGRTRWRQ